jgi:hypothetical protein
MQVARLAIVMMLAGTARADDVSTSVTRSSDDTAAAPLDVRLTLSTFLFRQTGGDAPPIADQGAPIENASPVHRYFGDLRMELSGGGLVADARVRQTTSARYQSGADGGGEYDIRTLAYKLGSSSTSIEVGRQYIDAVGATKIDGASITQRITDVWKATAFAGAFPQLGSRSVDTDYPLIANSDGSQTRVVPLTGGLGVAYSTPDYHGDVGLAAVYVAQEVIQDTAVDTSRVFATSSGYWRPGKWLDVYHFALVDVAHGASLTNGSLGIDTHPFDDLQLSASIHHVSVDLLQIDAKNLLADPDPTAIGIVQNNISLLRISSDVARIGASVAFAQRRFELSASGGYHYRPGVSVDLPDGSGAVEFPSERSADATIGLLDRKSIAGLRASLTASLTYPLDDSSPTRARGTVVRVAAGRAFAGERGQLEADVMGEKFHDANAGGGMCASSLNAFMCYGTSATTAAQAGVLVSWRLGREWLLLGDTHVGYQDVTGNSIMGPVLYPHAYSVTGFARIQWRYR